MRQGQEVEAGGERGSPGDPSCRGVVVMAKSQLVGSQGLQINPTRVVAVSWTALYYSILYNTHLAVETHAFSSKVVQVSLMC